MAMSSESFVPIYNCFQSRTFCHPGKMLLLRCVNPFPHVGPLYSKGIGCIERKAEQNN